MDLEEKRGEENGGEGEPRRKKPIERDKGQEKRKWGKKRQWGSWVGEEEGEGKVRRKNKMTDGKAWSKKRSERKKGVKKREWVGTRLGHYCSPCINYDIVWVGG